MIRILGLEGIQQFTDALFKVDVLRQGDYLEVHVCRFFKLEWTVSFEKHVIHALHVRDVIKDKVPQKLKLVL